ncbi:hypothetical protein AMTRI_Chr07g31450 [Amborella trichopoda]|uniref:Uncharacterized protein n=1 Tax=Amborella trichopoda TaxID=13333 RepID=W1NIC3_AMBTC|nr:hypothetical protein AMTR_s00009p00268450 [Amborella trichopoda]
MKEAPKVGAVHNIPVGVGIRKMSSSEQLCLSKLATILHFPFSSNQSLIMLMMMTQLQLDTPQTPYKIRAREKLNLCPLLSPDADQTPPLPPTTTALAAGPAGFLLPNEERDFTPPTSSNEGGDGRPWPKFITAIPTTCILLQLPASHYFFFFKYFRHYYDHYWFEPLTNLMTEVVIPS